MSRFLWICLGGAVGTGARYLLDGLVQRLSGASFPLGTLAVNAIGSFLLVLLMHVATATDAVSPTLRLALGTGVLGGFTTYSTFNYETIRSLEEGAWRVASLNVALTVGGCLAADRSSAERNSARAGVFVGKRRQRSPPARCRCGGERGGTGYDATRRGRISRPYRRGHTPARSRRRCEPGRAGFAGRRERRAARDGAHANRSELSDSPAIGTSQPKTLKPQVFGGRN